MKFAYADPPYFGYAKFYDHPQAGLWNDLKAHKTLVDFLCENYSDGWVMSLTSGNLHDILPLVPKKARIGAWTKPFCSFKKHVSPAYAWEPVIFMGGRKHDISKKTVRDWCAENITLKKGLTGAKPIGFCKWVIQLMNAEPTDTFDDLFPGTEQFSKTWIEFSTESPPRSTSSGFPRHG